MAYQTTLHVGVKSYHRNSRRVPVDRTFQSKSRKLVRRIPAPRNSATPDDGVSSSTSGSNIEATIPSLQLEPKSEGAQHREEIEEYKEVARKRMADFKHQVLNAATSRIQNLGSGREEFMPGLTERLRAAITALQEGLVERDTEVRLLLLAALSGEHILYIGPPGTAKSELGRRLAAICTKDGLQGKFFERLLTRFSVPEELFGPLSMRALEEDKYVRQLEGYLPDATVAFVDEIFKANSAILNTLLTILNERQFDNGNQRISVPLICLVGASNELPESEELDALYDRFLLRRKVSQVSAAGLQELLSNAAELQALAAQEGGRAGGTGAPHLQEFTAQKGLSVAELAEIRGAANRTVGVPQEITNVVTELRTWLQEKAEPPVYVSDRRLVKAIGLMKVAAYTSGRDKVSKYDCLLLKHTLWQQPDEAQRIEDWLLANLATVDGVGQSDYLLQGLFGRTCVLYGAIRKGSETFEDVAAELANLRQVLVDKLVEVTVNLGSEDAMKTHSLWVADVEVGQLAANLGPKLDDSKDALEKLLFDTVTLEVAVEKKLPPLTVAELLPARWNGFIARWEQSEVRSRSVPQAPPPAQAQGPVRAFNTGDGETILLM
eukprot:jgi/Botrbrau1/16722/Bobra.0276s0002.1